MEIILKDPQLDSIYLEWILGCAIWNIWGRIFQKSVYLDYLEK